GFTLTVMDGTNYTRTGNAITPALDFNGTLTVPVKVSDGAADSNVLNLSVSVTAVNDPPVITGQNSISTLPDTARTIVPGDLLVSDVDNSYPTGFTLTVMDGANYTRTGNMITPASGFTGNLSVPAKVNDGAADSNVVNLVVHVGAPNTPPSITGQNTVFTPQETARTIVFADLLVTDPDDTYPTGFTLTVLAGTNYTFAGNAVTPDVGFTGALTVPVKVNDGTNDSNVFNLTVTVTPPSTDPVKTVVYVTGDPVPGEPAGTVFKTFGPPQLDGSTLCFLATIVPTGAKPLGAIISGASPAVLCRVGGPAPDLNGATFSKLLDPVAAGGKVAFIGAAKVRTGTPAVTPANDTGIWADNFGPLALVAREGDGAPDAGTAVFKSFSALANHPNAIVFVAKLRGGGVTAATDTGVWRATSGGVSLLVREGDPLTVDGGAPRIVKTIVAFSKVSGSGDHNRWLDSTGAFHYVVTFTDGSSAAFTAPLAGAATLDLLSNAPATAPAGASIKKFGVPAANGSGAALLGTLTIGSGGVLSTNDTGIFTGDSGTGFSAVFREGDPVASADGATFLKFKDPASIGANATTFNASLKIRSGTPAATPKNDTGLWTSTGSTLSLLARESGAAPETGGAKFLAITGFEVKPTATPIRANAFTATLARGGGVKATNRVGLWAADKTGAVRLLARTGDPLTTLPASPKIKTILAFTPAKGSPGAGRAVNATGGVTFRASLGTAGQAIVVVQMP
ncbi:MAG: choice-of-anchor tandem repeat NxxGxxAF-containing protein, partial [Chthoniobacteraceae bacterium]